MTVIAFDTLDFATKLENAGLDVKIAKVQSEETARILNDFASNQLVTKQDLISTKIELKEEIRQLEMRMYGFIVKSVSFTVAILGGLQVLFHFIK